MKAWSLALVLISSLLWMLFCKDAAARPFWVFSAADKTFWVANCQGEQPKHGLCFYRDVDTLLQKTESHFQPEVLAFTLVGIPQSHYGNSWHQPSYQEFQARHRARIPVLYIITEDGNLYLWDALEDRCIQKLSLCLDKKISQASLKSFDLYFKGAWHTLLVISIKSPISVLKVLDITNGLQGSAFNELSQDLLPDKNTGPSMITTEPVLGRLANGQWLIWLGLFCSVENAAKLWAYNFETDEAQALFHRSGSGFQSLTAYDLHSRGQVDRLYIADEQQNLWQVEPLGRELSLRLAVQLPPPLDAPQVLPLVTRQVSNLGWDVYQLVLGKGKAAGIYHLEEQLSKQDLQPKVQRVVQGDFGALLLHAGRYYALDRLDIKQSLSWNALRTEPRPLVLKCIGVESHEAHQPILEGWLYWQEKLGQYWLFTLHDNAEVKGWDLHSSQKIPYRYAWRNRRV